MARENWYRDKSEDIPGLGGSKMSNSSKKLFQQAGNIQTSTLMFITSNRGGLLTKLMREKEQELASITGFKVKKHPTQLATLFSTYLAKGEHCGREDCHPCQTSRKRPKCKKSSILYE